MTETRALSADTLHDRESRRLVAWALEHGGNEFTIEVMALQGTTAPLADAFEDTLDPWAAASARRATLPGATKAESTREVRLWRLTPLSATLLHEFLPDGLFSHDVQERGWFENPIIYRDGAFLCGVLTHERDGYLRVSSEEARDLSLLGVPVGATLVEMEL